MPPLGPRSAPLGSPLLVGLAILAFGAGGCHGSGPTLTPEDIAANNRGVGLMGRFEYGPAMKVFQQLLARHPDWTAVKLNLAVARLNRQEEGDEAGALALAREVLQKHPGNLRARYVAGLLRLHAGDREEALADFKAVAEADPKDAYAAYYYAQCLSLAADHAAALKWYDHALAIDPYLRSALYGAFQSLQRLGRRDEAMARLTEYRSLEKNPRAHLAEFKYTRMGSKGEAVTVDREPTSAPPLPAGPPFAAPRPLTVKAAAELHWAPPEDRAAGLAAADLDGDGHLDLVIPGAFREGPPWNAVLMGRADGSFELDPGSPLAAVDHVNAVLFGDYDNDGRTDAYLCRRGPNQLWHRTEAGWEDVTSSSKTANGSHDTVDGLFVDADHDGDLDLLLANADGPIELLNNDRDGGFRPLAAERGLARNGRPARQVLVADLDGDRDLDLLVLHDAPPHEVFRNDRLWNYVPAPGFDAFEASQAVAVVAGDADADGQVEIYALEADGRVSRWTPGDGGWTATPIASAPPNGIGHAGQLALDDVDGDGHPELVRSGSVGWEVLRLPGGHQTFDAPTPGLRAWLPLVLDPGTGPAVVGLGPEGPSLWAPGPGRYRYAALSFTGREDVASSTRSNASGIGTRAAVRFDSHWSVVETLRGRSGPGQSLEPLAVGLAGRDAIDFVAIDWSDGVFQSELDLPAGKLHKIVETQRQLSSCPVLFAWNGTRYAFVTDFLGVGGLGYAVGPGKYATPRPWESIQLPERQLRSRAGRLELKLTEPMEETAYIDSVALEAYDLPPGWQMVLDERMGTGPPAPTGEPRFYRRELAPTAAVNDRGQDVLASLAAADREAAPLPERDRRFIGRLAREHVLRLEFPRALDTGPGQPTLVADGWIEYPYSQTSFAAWQAGAAYEPPTLEALSRDGRWRVVLAHFGYPAGMPRRMSVPLRHLPAGTRALRLRTNQEIYWDRIRVAFVEPAPPETRRQTLSLADAELKLGGFPRRATLPQQVPVYDYADRVPFGDTRRQEGFYTAFGPVRELLTAHDDAVAIFGPGEEIDLGFAAPSDPPAPGWSRIYVLATRGWAKDMDLYTRDGETVGPLPRSGVPSGDRARLLARYNTRYESGQ